MTHWRRLVFHGLAMGFVGSVVCSRPAEAGLMTTYSTSGSFTVNSQTGSTLTLSNGNIVIDLSYVGQTSNTITTDDPVAPFGSFTVTVDSMTGGGGANLGMSGSFTLDLTQTSPSSGSGVFTPVVSGNVKLGTSDVIITFNSPSNSVTLGAITYTLPSSIDLPSPAKMVGAFTTTNLTADITGLTTFGSQGGEAPEPATVVSAAMGGVILSVYVLRRRKRKES